MLTYSQSAGELKRGDTLLTVGFSGDGKWRNSPGGEKLVREGPIPQGVYQIYKPHRWLGTGWIMKLAPQSPSPRNSAQRYFLKSGDVSQGCINVPATDLERIVELVKAGEKTLQVIP